MDFSSRRSSPSCASARRASPNWPSGACPPPASRSPCWAASTPTSRPRNSVSPSPRSPSARSGSRRWRPCSSACSIRLHRDPRSQHHRRHRRRPRLRPHHVLPHRLRRTAAQVVGHRAHGADGAGRLAPHAAVPDAGLPVDQDSGRLGQSDRPPAEHRAGRGARAGALGGRDRGDHQPLAHAGRTAALGGGDRGPRLRLRPHAGPRDHGAARGHRVPVHDLDRRQERGGRRGERLHALPAWPRATATT